jgi:hypothetical protein
MTPSRSSWPSVRTSVYPRLKWHSPTPWPSLQPAVTSVIVGARTEDQLADNLAAADLKLAAADIERLDKVSAQPLPYPFWHHLNAEDRLSPADLTLLARHIEG